MGKKKFALLGLCIMVCLLIMSALSGSLLGYSNAWFTSFARADVSITANSLVLEEIVEGTLNGEIDVNQVKGNKYSIGSIASKINDLTVSYVFNPPADAGEVDPDTGENIYSIEDLKHNKPIITSDPALNPLDLSPGNSIEYIVNIKLHKNPPGIYKGQLELTFTVGKDVLTWVVPLRLIVQ
jgi:hypothetical protein